MVKITRWKTDKRWGFLCVDVDSGMTFTQVLDGYSSEAVIAGLEGMRSHWGSPEVLYTDAGAQLAPLAKEANQQHWVNKFGKRLRGYFGVVGTRWIVEVPKASWCQGKAEKMIQLFKSLYTSLLVDDKKQFTDPQLRLLFSRTVSYTHLRAHET